MKIEGVFLGLIVTTGTSVAHDTAPDPINAVRFSVQLDG